MTVPFHALAFFVDEIMNCSATNRLPVWFWFVEAQGYNHCIHVGDEV